MNNQPNNTHAVLYTRVSTSEQATTGFSLRDQEDRLRHHCQQKGIKVVAHFEEDHSAKTFDRPEWKKLMRYLEANHGEVDQVLVVRWDRFSRDFTDASQMIRHLDEDLGVEVQAIEQPIDHSVPEQRALLALYLATPEAENRRRSINTKKGMRWAMKEGRWVTRPPYGYKRAENETARIVPDEEKAEFVREAFRQAARTSLPLEQIRKDLWKKGFKISRARFPDLLRNPVYAGKIHIEAWRKEPEQTVEGLHEALVSEALFHEVQLKRFEEEDPRSTKTKRLNNNLPLRGHLVCPDCLEADEPNLLTGSGSRGRSKRYWYYHCHHKRGGKSAATASAQTRLMRPSKISSQILRSRTR